MPIKVIFGRPKKVVYSQGGRLEDTLINSAHCAIYGLRSVAAKGLNRLQGHLLWPFRSREESEYGAALQDCASGATSRYTMENRRPGALFLQAGLQLESQFALTPRIARPAIRPGRGFSLLPEPPSLAAVT
jgi:hypothetical protein